MQPSTRTAATNSEGRYPLYSGHSAFAAVFLYLASIPSLYNAIRSILKDNYSPNPQEKSFALSTLKGIYLPC